jgi:hypothetical protein
MNIEQAAKIVKSFARRGKYDPRPILKTALVTADSVVTTDTHRLIRVAHGEDVQDPYLHRYNEGDVEGYVASNYPQVSRLFPHKDDCQESFTVNVADFKKAHNEMLPFAKEEKNKNVYLRDGRLYASVGHEWETIEVDVPDDIIVAYNCQFMKDALVAIGKTKAKEATVYYYGYLRPMYIVAPGIEVLILPIRSDKLAEAGRND